MGKTLDKEPYMNRPVYCDSCQTRLDFVGGGHYACPNCKADYTDDFGKVKDYLEQYPFASSWDVHTATGVALPTMNQLLRLGRLEVPEGSPIFIKCEACGCDIRYGQYCRSCATKLSGKKGTAIDEGMIGEKPKYSSENGKMRFLQEQNGSALTRGKNKGK